MKRKRLLALMLAACVTVTSIMPVSAAQSSADSQIVMASDGVQSEDGVQGDAAADTQGVSVANSGISEKEVVNGTLSLTAADELAFAKNTNGDWELSYKSGNDTVYAGTDTESVTRVIITDSNSNELVYFFKAGIMLTGKITWQSADYFTAGENNVPGTVVDVKPGTEKNAAGIWYGQMVKNTWAVTEKLTYHYFGADGIKVNKEAGLYQIGDDNFLLNAEGACQTGIQAIDDAKYYFKEDTGARADLKGWNLIDGKMYFFDDTFKLVVKTAWQKINGTWYYFDKTGEMVTGFIDYNGKKYCLGKDGKMLVGFQEYEGEHYYFNKGGDAIRNAWLKMDGVWYFFKADSGIMAHDEFLTRSGKTYYLGSDGKMYTGFQDIDGEKYYFNKAGDQVKNQWLKVSGVWYFFKPTTGAMAHAEYLTRYGKTYYLGSDGKMYVGLKKIGDETYYFQKDGVQVKDGWAKIDGVWYFFKPDTGIMAHGEFLTRNGKTYYLDSDGKMYTGAHEIDGKTYYFDKSGAQVTQGWAKFPKGWVYIQSDGTLKKDDSWLTINGKSYAFDADGYLKIGWWKTAAGDWYYSNSSGRIIKNSWVGNYYLLADGKMAKSQWINGKYYVNASGKWVKDGEWQKIDGKWYYFPVGSDTYAKSKWLKLSGKWYYLGSDGVMYTGWHYIGKYRYYFKSSGVLNQNIHSLIGRQSSYYITVNRTKCVVTVYAKDSSGAYNTPVLALTCSVGLPATPTPTGTYNTLAKYRWKELMGPSYGQYCTRIVGGVLFHSVAGYNMTSYNIWPGEYDKLGQPASHGCVRLNVRDAKWIYDNCAVGTRVTIFDSNSTGPFDKPATIWIPASQNWDPTDPNI